MIDISESLLSNVFLFGDENKPWDTDRMTDMLRKVTGRQIGLKMTNRLYRHIAIAIDRQHIRPGMNDDDESGDSAAEDEASYAHDTMAAHSKRIADMRYARVNNLTGNLTPETMSIYREICDRSHTWLGMPSRDTRLGASGLRATPRFAGDWVGLAALRARQGGFVRAGFHQAPPGLII